MKKAFITATLITVTIALSSSPARSESETCDRFSFAVSGSKLDELPITILRGGMSPVLEIAGRTYNYDTTTHCLADSDSAKRDCSKSLKIMSGKKTVAVIEGQGVVSIAPTDEKGRRDFSQPYYSVAVERDIQNPSRPRFVLEAHATDGKTMGRIDGVEGMTATELTKFKGKLASAHHLIDLRSKNLVYANCRKLAVNHYNDSIFQFTPDRSVASRSAPALAPGSAPKTGSASSASQRP